MAFNGFLFINKDSNSPSLSRNTGSEAALASKVNKHVQQQRFWKSAGPRKNWYRPFVRSDSSSPSTPSSVDTCFIEELIEYEGGAGQKSPERSSIGSPRLSISSRRSSNSAKQVPRSTYRETVVKKEPQAQNQKHVKPHDHVPTSSGSPTSSDDFPNGIVVPNTPELRDVLSRHLQWAVSSSITEFAIHEGVRRIFENILTDEMHAAAFLAMATSQQRRTSNIVLPHDHSPEFYSYQATKLIREHIQANAEAIDPYVLVDVFRLAMCEWLKGNHTAARIHFAYIARNEHRLRPQNWGGEHDLEVITSEDIFLAIDIDQKPLLKLNWEPDLSIGSGKLAYRYPSGESPPISKAASTSAGGSEELTAGWKLVQAFKFSKAILSSILKSCLTGLHSFPNFDQIDFASATTGPIWVMKRRIHATLHRLQSIEHSSLSARDECICRTLIIILFLGSTTPARRIARTDVPQLAARLKNVLLDIEPLSLSQCTQSAQEAATTQAGSYKVTNDQALHLWMSITGLTAARDTPNTHQSSHDEVVQWFTKQSLLLTIQTCGFDTDTKDVKKILSDYLFLEHVHGSTVESLVASIRSRSTAERKVRESSQKFDFAF